MATRNNNPIEKELDAIRRKINKETKSLTAKDYLAYFNSSVSEAEKLYGYKFKRAETSARAEQ